MTLKEKFDNLDIMFENQIGSLKYDELDEVLNCCVLIADDYAIEFAEWCLKNGLFTQFKITQRANQELLEIFKKEKGL